ncbi:hypothetical protein ASPCADRAFT_205004 [Aspergillus carbonarius ITEM 5010]|uniref:Uncharacterized protein n=1 Tax=Aspergillus carbonarius (strain ITEM 5010) TaxID=602072 RepID=A0A1R3RTE1_ASPC5|nr:hypothetical protein ASPCADRAFT_205004 [Aspergillus carbonarius ITEM 5010]
MVLWVQNLQQRIWMHFTSDKKESRVLRWILGTTRNDPLRYSSRPPKTRREMARGWIEDPCGAEAMTIIRCQNLRFAGRHPGQGQRLILRKIDEEY